VNDWIQQALSILRANGVDTSQINPADLLTIIEHEFSGNPDAIDDWDSNALAGHPPMGLMQTTDSTFNAYKLPGHDDIVNPVDNIIAGVRYALARYGSISAVPGVQTVHDGGSYVYRRSGPRTRTAFLAFDRRRVRGVCWVCRGRRRIRKICGRRHIRDKTRRQSASLRAADRWARASGSPVGQGFPLTPARARSAIRCTRRNRSCGPVTGGGPYPGRSARDVGHHRLPTGPPDGLPGTVRQSLRKPRSDASHGAKLTRNVG
jgi:SLT domain-containing protein